VVEYSNTGGLKVAGVKVQQPRVSKFHRKVEDVTLYYDDNKAYTGLVSFDDEALGRIYGSSEKGVMRFFDKELKPLDFYAYSDGEDLELSSFDDDYDLPTYKRLQSRLSNITITGDVSASGTAQRIGKFTFTDLVTDNGNYIHGTSHDIGKTTFDNFYSSNGTSMSGTQMRIGKTSFGNWSTTDGNSISGTSQRIGNQVFHNYMGADGKMSTGTTLEIGGTSFTNMYDW
jgi:hypothetical protein